MKIRILSKLPQGDSKAYSLNALDVLKLARWSIMSCVGLALTYGLPYVTGRMWVLNVGGQMVDLTGVIVAAATLLAEALRRWKTSNEDA
jgi:hypothetical protein